MDDYRSLGAPYFIWYNTAEADRYQNRHRKCACKQGPYEDILLKSNRQGVVSGEVNCKGKHYHKHRLEQWVTHTLENLASFIIINAIKLTL